MLMNAQPRSVSNGFDTIVPIYRLDCTRRRFVQMMDNNINAWSVYKPVTSRTNDTETGQIETFDANENYPTHKLRDGYYQQQRSIPRAVPEPVSGIKNYTNSVYSHFPTQKETYQESGAATNMNCFQRPSPMLGDPYSQWMTEDRRGSFPGLLGHRQGQEDDCYHKNDVLEFKEDLPTSSLSQSSYSNQSTATTSYHMSDYSSYLNANTGFVATPMLGLETTTDSYVNSLWMMEAPQQDRIHDYRTFDQRKSHDGLPTTQRSQQQGQDHEDVWRSSYNLESDGSVQSMPPSTISPKLLTMNFSGTVFSYSGSNHENDSGQAEPDCPSVEYGSVYSDHGHLDIAKEPPSMRTARRKLPDAVPRASRSKAGATPHPDELQSLTKARRQSQKIRQTKQNEGKKTCAASLKAMSNKSSAKELESDVHRDKIPKRIVPKHVLAPMHDATKVHETLQAVHERDAKDDFLVRSKLAGMSYKDIRRKGEFTEAESTLRGRFRTLTKHKTARVRKPEWNDNDLRLLKKAVRRLGHGSDATHGKIPWKQVAEYIIDHGGSYHFGNATCRKRWDELQERL